MRRIGFGLLMWALFVGLMFGQTDQLAVSPKLVTSDIHGIYVYSPQNSGTEYTSFVVPLICNTDTNGVGTFIKGGTILAQWGTITSKAIGAPAWSSGDVFGSPTYSDTFITSRLANWYNNAACTSIHKQSILLFLNSSYVDGTAGNLNAGIPDWWGGQTWTSTGSISRATNGTNGIITITFPSAINFLTGTVVGPHPERGSFHGTNPDTDGVTQGVEIRGSSLSDLNGRVFPICDSNTTGCATPSATSLTVMDLSNTGSESCTTGCGGAIVSAPLFDITNDTCLEGGYPNWWDNNTDAALHDWYNHEINTFGADARVVAHELARGQGFENFPNAANGITATYNGSGVPNGVGACRGTMNSWGYGGGAAFSALGFDGGQGTGQTNPTGLATGEPAGKTFWQAVLLREFNWWKANLVPNTALTIATSLSSTIYGTNLDTATPNYIAPTATALGFALDSNGLQGGCAVHVTGTNYCNPINAEQVWQFPQTMTKDNNALYNFQLYGHGTHAMISQPLALTDPLGTSDDSSCPSQCGQVGPMWPLGRLILQWGIGVFEPYTRDVECTESGYDGASFGVPAAQHNNFTSCESLSQVPYDQVFKMVGAFIN